MRISKAKALKRVLKVVAAVAFFALCNCALTYALDPYGSKSQVIWNDYTQQEEIDTLFVGTSFAHQGFDPDAFDEVAGGSSFNLASPNQSIEDSYVAVRTAYEDFHVKRVILGISYSELYRSSPSNPQSTFLRERTRAVGSTRAVQAMDAELFQPDTLASSVSINGFFPWIDSHVDPNVSATSQNVQMKAEGIPLAEAAEVQDPTWQHIGKGYGSYNHVFDRNTELGFYFNEAVASGEVSGIDADRERTLRALCEYCQQNDIELVAIVVPLPAHNIEYYGQGYFEEGACIRDYLAQWNVSYYDMNLLRPEFLAMQDDDYYDYAHLNGQGAKRASTALAQLLGLRAEKGENGVSELFYSEGEYWSSLDTVSAVLVEAEPTTEGIALSCRGLSGPDTAVEYQICLKASDGSWSVTRDYDEDSAYFIEQPQRGAVEVRVNARAVGSKEAYESYCEQSVFY